MYIVCVYVVTIRPTKCPCRDDRLCLCAALVANLHTIASTHTHAPYCPSRAHSAMVSCASVFSSTRERLTLGRLRNVWTGTCVLLSAVERRKQRRRHSCVLTHYYCAIMWAVCGARKSREPHRSLVGLSVRCETIQPGLTGKPRTAREPRGTQNRTDSSIKTFTAEHALCARQLKCL